MQLLSKTIRTYLIYSIVIILAAVPLIYLLFINVIKNETEELLEFEKIKVKKEIKGLKTDADIAYYLKLKDEIQLRPAYIGKRVSDSVYHADKHDKSSDETIPYTISRFNVLISNKVYVAELKMSLLAAKALIRTIIKTQFFIIAGLLAGLYFINKRMSVKIWKPFYQTLEQLKEYKVTHNPDFHLAHSDIHEFELLNQTINQLTSKNHQVFMAQKEFTENAAHEMQTPLAILHSNLELLIQSENLQEEQAGLIESMIDVCDRLSRLNISLLLLAKIENENEHFLEKETLPIVVIIQSLLKQFSEQFKSRNISCSISVSEQLFLSANKTLIEILFSNLISNAIKYNIGGGTFEIGIKNKHLVFVNSGQPVAMDEYKIFERFSKNAANQNSIGLGLAIVKRICDSSGYTIKYYYEVNSNQHVFDLKMQ